jgi:hypothetical protein
LTSTCSYPFSAPPDPPVRASLIETEPSFRCGTASFRVSFQRGRLEFQ